VTYSVKRLVNEPERKFGYENDLTSIVPSF